MNSLNDPKIASTLDLLHRRSFWDFLVLLSAAPAAALGALTGKRMEDAAASALQNAYIPIDRAQGVALYQFARASGARRIVEFGTSFGVSAIYLAAALRDNGGGELITTELAPKKVSKAREHFARAGVDKEITLLEGDARETLASLDGEFDFIFLDGWKYLCHPVLKILEPKLREGAAVFCDDTHMFRKTLKPYLDYVRSKNDAYSSMDLPLGDGLEFSVRLKPGSSEL